MKLLILPAYFFPESMSSSLLDEHRYQAFTEEGFFMDVYTPLPTRGVTKDVWKEYHKKKEEVLFDHHMVVRRFSLMREGQNPVLRAFRYFLAFIKQYRYGMRANNVDCVYLVSTPPIQGLIGAFLKKKKHIPFVYNVQDIFPDSLVGSGLAKKNGFLWRLGSYITRFTYKYCDRIIVISQDFKNNLLLKGVPENKIEVIYNWVDEDKVYPVEDSMNPLFDEFNITRSKFRVVYAGNLGNAQNIDILIDAASRLKNSDNIEFIIIGEGGKEQELSEKVTREGLTNVKMLPLQPLNRVSYVYSLGNICVVSCKSGLGGAAMPSKTWSIMACGRAVLANFDDGELKTILEDNNCGIFTSSGDLSGFISAIESLSDNPQRCFEMGDNGRHFVLNNLTRRVGTKKYVNVIKEVVNNHRNY